MVAVDGVCVECGRRVTGWRIGSDRFLAEPLICEECAPRCAVCGHIQHGAGDCRWCGCQTAAAEVRG